MLERNMLKDPIMLIAGVPILFIVVVGIFVYLPSAITEDPQYDFLYAQGYRANNYFVENGKIQALMDPNNLPEVDPRTEEKARERLIREIENLRTTIIYRYDTENESLQPISFTEAKKLNLDPSSKSPDGYTFQSGQRASGFFPFFIENRRDGYELSKGVAKVKLPMDYRYGQNICVGWAISE